LSTISIKCFHLFKIAKSVINFCLKFFFNSAILNRCEFFSGMMDHVTCTPCEPYNFSLFRVAFSLSPTHRDYQSLYRITSCRHLIFLNIRHGCNHYVVPYSFSPWRSLRTIIVLFFLLKKKSIIYLSEHRDVVKENNDISLCCFIQGILYNI